MSRPIAENRKARYQYTIDEIFETGLVLQASEVKSLRAGRANIAESHARPQKGALWLVNAHIEPLASATSWGQKQDSRRMRKLLLHQREISRLIGAVEREGATLVPLRLYFNQRGLVKLALALARGKKQHDKRAVIKQRDWDRQRARLLKRG